MILNHFEFFLDEFDEKCEIQENSMNRWWKKNWFIQHVMSCDNKIQGFFFVFVVKWKLNKSCELQIIKNEKSIELIKKKKLNVHVVNI